jgi:hypothetical protein
VNPAAALRVVRVTARTSAMLFASAQAAPLAGSRGARAGDALYQAFVVAHVVHFAAVSRYAVVTGGRDLFPGNRDLDDVGGWLTIAGIFTGFAGLATMGWFGRPTRTRVTPRTRAAGTAARTVIGTMFTATFAGRVSQSPWHAVPTVISGTTTILATVVSNRPMPITGRAETVR